MTPDTEPCRHHGNVSKRGPYARQTEACHLCLTSCSNSTCRAHAAEALRCLSAALADPASLPKRLQPLAPLAPILETALAPEPAASAAAPGSETAAAAEAAAAAGSHAAAAGDPEEDTAMHDAAADGDTAGAVSSQSRSPRRLPAVTALLLAETATQLAAPNAGMARRLGRLLSSRPDLDLEVAACVLSRLGCHSGPHVELAVRHACCGGC